MKVYGPYTNYQDRKFVIIRTNGKNKTTQYARYLLEQHLGRSLSSSETVDHIDGNFRNDSLDNLQILSRADNIRKSIKPKEMITFTCPVCKKETTKEARNIRANRKQGKAGPYCGKSCSGKVNH